MHFDWLIRQRQIYPMTSDCSYCPNYDANDLCCSHFETPSWPHICGQVLESNFGGQSWCWMLMFFAIWSVLVLMAFMAVFE